MAFNNLTNRAESLTSLAAFQAMSNNFGSSLYQEQAGEQYVGLESASLRSSSNANAAKVLGDAFNDISTTIKNNLLGETDDQELDALGLESAARAAMMLAAPKNLASKMIAGWKNGGQQGEHVVSVNLAGPAGDIGILDVGLERFNTASFDKFRDETLYLNYHTAQANQFTELFFNTVQVGADMNGVSLSLRRDVVQAKWCNPMTGEQFNLGKTHLIEAIRYSDMLSGEHNRLIPQVRSAEDEKYFVDKTLFAPETIEVDGQSYVTAPLKPSESEWNLLGISRAPGQMDQKANFTSDDMVDPNLKLKNIYLNIAGKGKLVVVPTMDLLHSTFLRGPKMGSDSRTMLNFKHDQVFLSTSATDVAGAEVAELAALKAAGVESVVFKTFISGTFHHETSNIIVKPAGIEFVGAYRASERNVNLANDATIKPLLAALAGTLFACYDLHGTLSNKNVRIQGTLLDNETTEFTVPMLYLNPVSVRRPIDKTDTSDDIKTLVSGRTIRTDNNAVKYLLNNLQRMADFCKSGAKLVSPFDLGSPGAFYVTPWVVIEEHKLEDLVSTQNSAERADDINAALIDLLADRATRMMTDTVYLPAKRAYYGNPNAKVKWGLGTTPQLARHLVMWDNRKLGGQDADMDPVPTVRTTEDLKMEDTIILVPISENGGSGYDPFAFGSRFVQPSIVMETQMTMGGETFKLLQTIPVETFLINMPLAYMMKVPGLSAYIAGRGTAAVDVVSAPAGDAAAVTKVEVVNAADFPAGP